MEVRVAQFKAMAQGVEVNGETVLAIADGMGLLRARGLQLMAACGITDPQPGRWYPQQAWLDAFRRIGEIHGASVLNLIGQKIPANAQFPPQIDSIEKALAAIDVAYHMNHRGGEIGTYGYQPDGPRAARLTCHNPYPCAFDRGIIEAMAGRFRPLDAKAIQVTHGAGPCRAQGGDACVYLVRW
jgi:hypothetical protein